MVMVLDLSNGFALPPPLDSLHALELLSRDELLAAVNLFGVKVPDRRAKDGIVDALVASRKVSLAQVLADFPRRRRLKDICAARCAWMTQAEGGPA